MDRVSSTGLTSANEGNDPVVTARADGERSVSRIRRAILTIRASPPSPSISLSLRSAFAFEQVETIRFTQPLVGNQ